MSALTISPAYGRDYTTPAQARQAWFAGADFINHGVDGQAPRGTYVSIRDVSDPSKPLTIRIRFAGKSRVTLVHSTQDGSDMPCRYCGSPWSNGESHLHGGSI